MWKKDLLSRSSSKGLPSECHGFFRVALIDGQERLEGQQRRLVRGGNVGVLGRVGGWGIRPASLDPAAQI